jgi:membrane protease YdiL (CAAX protease family)
LQPTSPQRTTSRFLQLVLFVVGGLWLLVSSHLAAVASQGITTRLNLPVLQPLLQQAFWLFLLVVVFTLLGRSVVHPFSFRNVNALPSRPTAAEETQRGIALGWVMALIAVIPMVLTGALHPQIALSPGLWLPTLAAIATFVIAMLALEVAYRGFLFARLIAVIGPVPATIVLSLIFALASNLQFNSGTLGVASAFIFGIVLSIAYLRTHALWLGWGLHLGWALTAGIFLGLPVAGYTPYDNIVTTSITGPDWIAGGTYGPDAALFTLVVLLAAIFPLYRLTRDYAWNYTHAPIAPMGQAVVIAPPAAHTAMEEAAAANPAPLVQILASTPAQASTLPEIQERLRNTTSSEN